MVYEEQLGQIQAQKQAIEEQRRKLEQAGQEVEQFQPTIALTRQERMIQTPERRIRLREVIHQRTTAKQTAQQQIQEARQRFEEQAQPVESQLSSAEGQIQSYNREVQEWQEARNFVEAGGVGVSSLPSGVREKALKIMSDQAAAEQLQQSLSVGELPKGVDVAIASLTPKIGEEKAYQTILGFTPEQVSSFKSLQSLRSAGITPIYEGQNIIGYSQSKSDKVFKVGEAIPEELVGAFRTAGLLGETTVTTSSLPIVQVAPQNVLTSAPLTGQALEFSQKYGTIPSTSFNFGTFIAKGGSVPLKVGVQTPYGFIAQPQVSTPIPQISLMGDVEKIAERVGGGFDILFNKKVTAITKTEPGRIIPTRSTLIDIGQPTEKGQFDIPSRTYKVMPITAGTIAKTGVLLGAYATPYLGEALIVENIATSTGRAIKAPTLKNIAAVGGNVLFGLTGTRAGREILGVGKIATGKYVKVTETFEKPTSMRQLTDIYGNPIKIENYPQAMGADLTISQFPARTMEVIGYAGKRTKVETGGFFTRIGLFKPNVVYEGVPYGKEGQKAYQEALTMLKAADYVQVPNKLSLIPISLSDKAAKSILRFTAPKQTTIYGAGKISVAYGAELSEPKILFAGQVKADVVKFVPKKTVSPEGIEIRKIQQIRQKGYGFNVRQPAKFVEETKGIEKYISRPTLERFELPKRKTKLGLPYPKRAYVKTKSAGKTMQTFGQLSALKESGKGLFAEFYPMTIYEERSLTKSLIPTGRKVIPSKSILRVIEFGNKPAEIFYPAPFRIFKEPPKPIPPATIPFTPQRAKSLIQTLKGIYGKSVIEKVSSSIPKLSAIAPKPTKISSMADIIPKSVKPEQSIYFGKGIYERTEGGLLPGELTRMERITIRQIPTNVVQVSQRAVLMEQSKLQNKQIENLENKLGNKIINRLQNKIQAKQVQRTQEKINERIQANILSGITSRTETKLSQKITTRLRQALRTNQASRTRQSIAPPSPPPVGKRLLLKKAKMWKTKKGKEEEETAYNVYTWIGGRKVRLGKGLPVGRATKLGAETVLKTLRASFKLEPSGTTQLEDIGYTLPKNVFVPSKREAGRIVQRKTTRFSRGIEAKLGVQARGKKIKWF